MLPSPPGHTRTCRRHPTRWAGSTGTATSPIRDVPRRTTPSTTTTARCTTTSVAVATTSCTASRRAGVRSADEHPTYSRRGFDVCARKEERTGTAPAVRATMRRKSVRKILATVVGATVALSLAACGGSGDGGGGG